MSAATIDQEVHNLGCDVEVGVKDCLADNPDLFEDQVWAEIAYSILAMSDASHEAKAEFMRINGLYPL